MSGKQAKIMTDVQVAASLRQLAKHRHPTRDRVILLLSVKAGLRAGEIAALTWSMVTEANDRVGHVIALENRAAKKGSGRTIPLHPDLRRALRSLRHQSPDKQGPVIRSERGGAMSADSLVNWFAALYCNLGFAGCSSHSGRRTFITKAARRLYTAGASLRDVQELAGHRSLAMTQSYIEGDTDAKRRLVRLL